MNFEPLNKIAYIELDTHAEIAGNFMELMNDSKEFEIDYFFSEKVLKSVGKHASNIRISDASMILEQLHTQKYDLVIIATVHRYFHVFRQICEIYNTSVIVHNLNFSKISKIKLIQNIFKKDFQYRLKLLLKEDLLFAPDVYAKAKNLLVLDENMVSRRRKFLPIFFTKIYEKPQNKNLRIVIPGSVSQERRDYKHVMEKIKNFGREIPEEISGKAKPDYEIVFLGKAKGKELTWITETPMPKNVHLKYSQDKIPSKIFDEEMQKADILWCPVQRETEFFSEKEIYGVTKMSGNIGDAIKYGKPVIFPKNFSTNYPFIFPENNDVEHQIFHFKNLDHFDFSKKYSKEMVLGNLEKTLKNLL